MDGIDRQHSSPRQHTAGRAPIPSARSGADAPPAFRPPPPYGRPRFDPPPTYRPLSAPSETRRRVQAGGGLSMVVGLITMGLAFAGQASAQHPAAQASAACGANAWTATITVSNSPRASNGIATISGTGTALDGGQLAAGGGQQSVTLTEPLTVNTVTVVGRLTWPKNYAAPFHATAVKPAACAVTSSSSGGALEANAGTDAASTSAGSSGANAGAVDGNSTAAAAAVPALTPAARPAADPKVTLCHATNSNSNPYVQITVAAAGAFNGHLGHTGPIWNPTLKANGTKWGDIIPPFTFRGQTYSLNWPAGQAIFAAGCSVAPPVTTTATVTSPGPTVTVTGPTATVTVNQTATVTVGGPTVTLVGAPLTVTETVSGSAATVTVSSTVTDTVTATVVNCPPGAGLEGAGAAQGGGAAAEGSLAFTGSGGDNALTALLGGALTAGGMVCLIMARRRGGERAH